MKQKKQVQTKTGNNNDTISQILEKTEEKINVQNSSQKTQKEKIDVQNSSQKTQNEKIKQNKKPFYYKPYVDGLRTIAILVVVIYHAFPKFLVGGFIGVDVFFVISGYLITGIIVKQSLKNKFSYVDFYSRRVKRIYPALLLILGFVLFVVSKTYGPSELDFTLKTLSASTLFSANLQVLVHEKGYFDADVHTNPLLHLWSLGVEEQFYIFWPCLIGLCLSKFQKYTLHGLSIYAAFSFVFGIAAVFINTKFAFYFPLCRFWQMAVGGLISYLNVRLQNKKINEALSIAGTMSILITIWIVNEQSLFPGFWALVPTLAAACIIQAGPQPFINRHILSSKVFVFIGKISYPMYLWHWPLLVFSRYLFPKGSTSILGHVQVILLMTLGLSVLTYYFVENPIRKMKNKKIIIVLLVLMLTVGVFSFKTFYQAKTSFRFYDKQKIQDLILQANKLLPPTKQDFIERNGKQHPNLSKNKNRSYPTIQKIRLVDWILLFDFDKYGRELLLQKRVEQGSKYFFNEDFKQLQHFSIANQGKQNMLLIVGDSHSMKISYRFQQLHQQSINQNKTDTFPTIVSMNRPGYQLDESNYLLNLTRKMVKQYKTKRLLLACHWIYYVTNIDIYEKDNKVPEYKEEKLKNSFKQFFAFIKQMQSQDVQVSVLTIDIHDTGLDPKLMVDFNGIIEDNIKPVRRSQFRSRYKRLIDQYEANLKDLNVDLIDLTDNLCYEDVCHVLSPSGYAVYEDSDHYGKLYSRHWISAVDHLVQF